MIFYSYNNCHKFKIYILLYLYFYILIFKNFKNFIKYLLYYIFKMPISRKKNNIIFIFKYFILIKIKIILLIYYKIYKL